MELSSTSSVVESSIFVLRVVQQPRLLIGNADALGRAGPSVRHDQPAALGVIAVQAAGGEDLDGGCL